MKNDLSVCLIQSELIWEKKQENLDHFEKIINDQPEKVDLFILPEMFSTAFTMQPKEIAETMSDDTIRWMLRVASAKNAYLTGSVVIEENKAFFNRMILAGPNQSLEWYDKRHLFKMAGEHHQYQEGKERKIFYINGWKILPQVCYDLRFPVFARNQEADYDLAIYVANWPSKRISAWKILLNARAIENQAYVIGVNRIGTDQNGWSFPGASSVIDPSGELLWQGTDKAVKHVHVLSKTELTKTREHLPFLQDGDEFEIKL